ncbi:cytochrome c3 family protein [Gordonibacter sp.]|uniref:cytochrome c3 family protein n=1 Tax=Gordonibacter sp. TaxID=1968902 RepID=UPI002FCBECFF
MTTHTLTHDRRIALLAGIVLTMVLAAVLSLAVGCSPKASTEAPAKSEQNSASSMDGQPVNWTMQSDCATCHTSEAASPQDAACVQAVAHEAEGVTCAQCHTDESTLSTSHTSVKFGDKPATKPTVVTVDEQTCVSCHGSMQDMAAKTVDSKALTDDNGVTVNPHERPAGQAHEDNPATCTDCHNNHSKAVEKDAMKYCAQCHHRGTFQCGTCHELRERSTK